MATVFKRTRIKPLPPGAKVRESERPIPKGATVGDGVAEWTDRNGMTIKAPLTADGQRVTLREAVWTNARTRRQQSAPTTPDGKAVLAVETKYSAKYIDASGEWVRKSTGTSDRESAVKIAKQWETDAKNRREGSVDVHAERLTGQGKRPIAEHLDAYLDHLATKNDTENHRNRTRSFCEEIIEAAGWMTVRDIEAEPVNRYAAAMLKNGKASRTVQSRLQAIKGFTRWLVPDRWPFDPLAGVRKPNPQADRRHERRMLLPEEWPHLRDAAEKGSEISGLSGPDRCTLYMLAIQTGLRVNELAGLTRGKVILSATHPHVLCKAAGTKNRKPAKQYIDPELAERLRELGGRKSKAAPMFVFTDQNRVSDLMRADLAEARKQWIKKGESPKEKERRGDDDFLSPVNADGEALDFHALRHTCGAWLALAGEHPKVIQTVMRHASITTTMDTYGHLFPGQAEGAVLKLAGVMHGQPLPKPEELKAV